MILFQIVYSIDILSSDLILLKQIRNINGYILVHVFKARHWFTMYYELTTSIFYLKETCMISIWAMIIQSINKWSINLKNYFSNLKTSLYTNHIERLQGGLFLEGMEMGRYWYWPMFYTSNMFFFPQTKLSFPSLFVLGVSGSAVTTLERAATSIRYAFSPIPLSPLLCQRGSRSLRGPYRRQKSKHVDNLFITYINSSTSNLLISNLNSFSRSLLAFQRNDSFSSALSNDDGMFQGFFFSKIDENNRLFFSGVLFTQLALSLAVFLKFEFIANFLIIEPAYIGCDAHQNIEVKRIFLPTIGWDKFFVGCT